MMDLLEGTELEGLPARDQARREEPRRGRQSGTQRGTAE